MTTKKRLNAAVTPAAEKAILLIMAKEGVSLTEAVRRLVAYGEEIYKQLRVNGDQVLVSDSSGKLFEVTLVD